MKTETIAEIINRENENRERQAADSARRIITEIGQKQEQISNCTKRITELRAGLKALEVETIDAKTVLGE